VPDGTSTFSFSVDFMCSYFSFQLYTFDHLVVSSKFLHCNASDFPFFLFVYFLVTSILSSCKLISLFYSGNGRNLYVLDALAGVERLKCQELAAAGNVHTKNVTTAVQKFWKVMIIRK